MTLKRTLLSMCIVTALSACGSSNKDKNEAVDQDKSDTPVETAVSGKAVKGVLANAKLTVYKYVNGEAVKLTSDEIKEDNLTTDVNGNYTFTVLDYNGPIKVVSEVSTDPNSPTTMICDAPEGCGDVNFGSIVNLTVTEPDFKLSAVSNVTSGTAVTLNVSTLTHFAAALVENESNITSEVIQEKSSVIANTFGIQGSITELEPTNIDNIESVTSEDNDAELRYGFINAGFAQALYSSSTGEFSFFDRLESAVTDVTENDGAFIVKSSGSDDNMLNLEAILDGAGDTADLIVSKLKQDGSLSGSSVINTLNLLETKLENEKQNQILLAGIGGRTNTVTEQVTEGDAIAKAKAMVSDIRVLSNLFDVTHSSNQDLVMEGERFSHLLQDASELIETEMDSFALLGNIADAVSQISMEQESSNATTFELADYTEVAGVSGTIVFDKENYQFSVNANGNNSETANLAMSLTLDESGQTLLLTLNGQLETSQASFSIEEGSQISVNLDKSVTKSQLEDGSADVEVVSGSLNLETKLAQKATASVTNPISFEGSIVAGLVTMERPSLQRHYVYDNSYEHRILESNTAFDYEVDKDVMPESVSLSGSFQAADGQHLTATLTVDAQDAGQFEYGEFEQGIGVPLSEPMIIITTNADGTTLDATYTSKYDGGEFSTSYQYVDTNSEVNGNYKIISSVRPGENREGNDTFRELQVKSGLTESTETGSTNNYLIVTDWSHYTGESIWVESKVVRETDQGAYIESSSLFLTEDEYDGTLTHDDLFNDEGSIVHPDGQVVEPQIVDTTGVGDFSSFDSLVDYAVNLETLSYDNRDIKSAIDHFKMFYTYEPVELRNTVDGAVAVPKTEIDKIQPNATDVEINAYIVQPKVKDAMTVEVSTDSNTVTVDLIDRLELEFKTESGSNFSHEQTLTEDGQVVQLRSITQSGMDVTDGITRYMITDNTTYYYNDGNYDHTLLREVSYQDTNNDGVISDSEVEVILFNGNGFNSSGQLVDHEGNVVGNGWNQSLASMSWELSAQGLNLDNETGLNVADNSALDIVKRLHEKARNEIADNYNNYYYWHYLSRLNRSINDVGEFGRFEFLDVDTSHEAFVAGNTTSFDASVVYPDDLKKGETEDNYLDLNAALTLAFKFGDYDFDIELAGERTTIEDGDLELSVAYQTPDLDSQRSLSVRFDTQDEDTIGIANAEGVVVRLKEPDPEGADATDGEVLLGEIRVGVNAVHAADVVKRGSVIMIVYKDDEGTVESL